MTMQEIARGFGDHLVFARESLSVRDKSGAIIPYRPSVAQIKLNQAIDRARRERRPPRIVYLKARQVFVSTGTAARFFHETAFTPGQHGLVIAHELKSARNIFAYYRTFQKEYKPFGGQPLGAIHLDPLSSKPKSTELEWTNGSWIRIATADNVETGRSVTVQRLHLSEYAFYRDPRTLMAGAMKMVPDAIDTAVVVESTANGVGNDFHQLWQLATDPQGGSEWIPVFCAWWEHPEYSRALPCPKGEFFASLDDEERELMQQFRLSLEQLAWRRWSIKTEFRGDIEKFRQEDPSTPEEAFRLSGRPVFSEQHLSRMPVIREAPMRGRLIEELIGSQRKITYEPNERGDLTVYRKPEAGHFYAIGADTSEGIDINEGKGTPDADWSVANVFDINSGEQVANLRGRIDPPTFGAYCCTLGRWYNFAFLVIEANNTGQGTIPELLRQGYPPAMLYHRSLTPEDLTHMGTETSFGRVGWKTTTVTRPQMVFKLSQAIREMSIVIRHPHTLQEHQTFVYHANSKPAAQTGQHDDEVFATGLGVVGIEQFPRSLRQQPTPRQQSAPVQKWGRKREPEDVIRRGRVMRLR